MAIEWCLRTSMLRKDEDLPDKMVAGGGDFQEKEIWWKKISDILSELPPGSIPNGSDELVKASSDDPTAGYLDAKIKNSLEINLEQVQLVNDEETPGAYKVYATDVNGNKGWKDKATLVVEIQDGDLATPGSPILSDFTSLVTANSYEDAFIYYGTTSQPTQLYYVDKDGALLNMLNGFLIVQYNVAAGIEVWATGYGITFSKTPANGEYVFTIPENVLILGANLSLVSGDTDGNGDLFVAFNYSGSRNFNQTMNTVWFPDVSVVDNNATGMTRSTPKYISKNIVTGITAVGSGDMEIIIQDANSFFATPTFSLKFM